MGNACSKRFQRMLAGDEQFYRDLIAKEAQEKFLADQRAEEEAKLREEKEAAEEARKAEVEKAEKHKISAICREFVLGMLERKELSSLEQVENEVSKQFSPIKSKLNVTRNDQLTYMKQFCDLQQKVEDETNLTRAQIANLESWGVKIASVDDLENLKEFFLSWRADLGKEISDLQSTLDTFKAELEQAVDSADADHKEVKMLIATLESEIRSTKETLTAVHARVADLELAAADDANSVCTEAHTDGGASSATGFSTRVQHVAGMHNTMPAGSSDASKGGAAAADGSKGGKKNPLETVAEPRHSDDSDSDSEEKVTVPYTTGKMGVNAVELVDWKQLRSVQKKQKGDLNEIDKIKMRRLTTPPLRSKIQSWRRWKESMYYWIHDLRRVRVPFSVMGAQVLEQSFQGHEGEHAVAEQASSIRDIIEMMEAVDLRFATPTRGLLEKLEEWVPLITRDDGVSPQMFLHLLSMVYEGERRVGAAPRTEHSKVTRALAALRIHNDKDTIVRSKLSTDIHAMQFSEVEHIIDALNITDTTRYDSKGQKPEKHKGPNYLQDLLNLLGDRQGQDPLGDHSALNNFFAAGTATSGTAFATAGGPAPGGHKGGTSQPGTPRTGGPRNPGGRSKTEQEKHQEDVKFWEEHNKVSASDKEKQLEERMKALKSENATPDYWCPLGDWCQAIRTTGYCKYMHKPKEYGRGLRRFERDFPEKYRAWQEKKKAAQRTTDKKKQEEKKKGGAASTST
eukprot:g18030.t1